MSKTGAQPGSDRVPVPGGVHGEVMVFQPMTIIDISHGGVQIGDNSLLSMHCRILSSTHAIPTPDQLIRYTPDTLQPTVIGSDVWLGAGVTVFGGVTIGNGCVVGAGSVVTKNLPPGTISHGSPARVVRNR